MSAGKAGEWFQLKKVTAYQDTRSLDILPAVFYANEKKGVRLSIFRDTEKKMAVHLALAIGRSTFCINNVCSYLVCWCRVD